MPENHDSSTEMQPASITATGKATLESDPSAFALPHLLRIVGEDYATQGGVTLQSCAGKVCVSFQLLYSISNSKLSKVQDGFLQNL